MRNRKFRKGPDHPRLPKKQRINFPEERFPPCTRKSRTLLSTVGESTLRWSLSNKLTETDPVSH